eukprot:5404837-Prymnesium_polylepis.1
MCAQTSVDVVQQVLLMIAFFQDSYASFYKSDFSGDAEEYLPVTQIRYTQDSIKWQTRDGYVLSDVIRQLDNGSKSAHKLPVIQVFMNKDGKIFSVDNRRLYVFKQANKIYKVPVKWINKVDHVTNKARGLVSSQRKAWSMMTDTRSKRSLIVMESCSDSMSTHPGILQRKTWNQHCCSMNVSLFTPQLKAELQQRCCASPTPCVMRMQRSLDARRR